MSECPHCEGRGAVDVGQEYHSGGWHDVRQSCPECEGTGKVPDPTHAASSAAALGSAAAES
jgi:DnaJ-class molecular chaperone